MNGNSDGTGKDEAPRGAYSQGGGRLKFFKGTHLPYTVAEAFVDGERHSSTLGPVLFVRWSRNGFVLFW